MGDFTAVNRPGKESAMFLRAGALTSSVRLKNLLKKVESYVYFSRFLHGAVLPRTASSASSRREPLFTR